MNASRLAAGAGRFILAQRQSNSPLRSTSRLTSFAGEMNTSLSIELCDMLSSPIMPPKAQALEGCCNADFRSFS